MKKYLNKFVNVTPSHYLELFDKLVSPVLNYASEVYIERVHLQFCKRLLSVKQCTQNDCVYGELGRYSFQNIRYYNIIKYWIKILHCREIKYVKIVYNVLHSDATDFPNKTSWVTLLRDLIGSLGIFSLDFRPFTSNFSQ